MQMAYSFTDMAWLGRLNTESVAAVGLVSVFLWISNAMTYLTKTGSEVTIGQAIGRNDAHAASTFASHNSTISIILGLIWGIGYLLLSPSLIALYQPSAVVEAHALEYMYIATLGLPITFLTATLFGIYNATGNSHVPFWILGIGLGCNMLLDPLLIHMLDYGVAGAAWATVLSQALVLGVFLYRLKLVDQLLGKFDLLTRLKRNETWRIIQIGLPASALNILFALVTIYMGRLASAAGGHVGIAVLTTGGQLEALTYNTAQGATTALSSVVAQNYAAGRRDRMWHAFGWALGFTLLIGFLGTCYFYWGGQDLFELIVPDPITANAGGVYLRISAYSQMMMMTEITAQGLLYGVGRSYLPASISILGNVLRIPLALMMTTLGFGITAIWWAISLSAALKGILALIVVGIYYRQYSNRYGTTLF